jgi:hypothetical protein
LNWPISTGALITSVHFGADFKGDLFYDTAKSRVYVIGGGGFADVFDQKDPDHYIRIEHLATATAARTGFFAPDRNNLLIGRSASQRAACRVPDFRHEVNSV